MNRFSFEANKYHADNKQKAFPSLPALPTFNSFLLLDSNSKAELVRWNTLNDILRASNIPYNVLEGDKQNFYYRELQSLVVNKACPYSVGSLELNYNQQIALNHKKTEFFSYYKVVLILKKIFNLALNRKWKEAIISISIVNDLLSDYKVYYLNIDSHCTS